MAYLLGLKNQQARVWAATELAAPGQGVPAVQPRYVLLDEATKRPVPGQQIRRKGQALEVWVDGQLVLVLPAFFHQRKTAKHWRMRTAALWWMRSRPFS